ncbi:MAG: glycosyltransferase family 39 protein, partial [Flavobacteriales bacterium]|nr:glycosyltransferase family 39 protein [Flavobacteriales bacterium]
KVGEPRGQKNGTPFYYLQRAGPRWVDSEEGGVDSRGFEGGSNSVKKNLKYLQSIDSFFRGYPVLSSILVTSTIFLLMGFLSILKEPPQGIHFIRQTDSLSFASNYYRNDFNFFEPAVFNQTSNNGQAACEFPVLYYLTSLLYLLFGESDTILRSLNLILSIIGLIYLFKSLYMITKDVCLSILLGSIPFASTIYLYYSANYLSDSGALSSTFIAVYFGLKHFQEKKSKHFFLACIFFTIASLLKIPFAIYFIAYVITVVLSWNSIFKVTQSNLDALKRVILILICSALPLLWYLYSIDYNERHHDYYFLTRSTPLWTLNKVQTDEVLHMAQRWSNEYFYQPFQFLFTLGFLTMIVFGKRIPKKLLMFVLLILAGLACYLVLFFEKFRDHDYYFLPFIPCLILFLLCAIIVARSFQIRWLRLSIAITISLLLISGIIYSTGKLQNRYAIRGSDYFGKVGFQISDNKTWIEQNLQNEDSLLVIIGDPTLNGSLYSLKRKGWTIPDTLNNQKMVLEKVGKEVTGLILLKKDYEKWDILQELGFEVVATRNDISIMRKVE